MSGKVISRAWSLLTLSKVHSADHQAGYPLLVCAKEISGALFLSPVLYCVLVVPQAPSAPQSFGSTNLLWVLLIATDFHSSITTGDHGSGPNSPGRIE